MDDEVETTDEAAIIKVGDSLPQFNVRMMDGSFMSTDSLLGRRSVVTLFNTGCRDCKQELPILDSLYRNHKDDADVRFVAISREEEAETIWEFWDAHEMILPFSAQADRTVYSLFAKSVIPRLYLSGPDGKVKFMHDDQQMPSLSDLEKELQSL